MALKNYKINEVVKQIYQAAGAASGISVVGTVYDNTDAALTTPVDFTEIGGSGRYYGSFTPTVEGEWHLHVVDSNGGKLVKQYSVGGSNVNSIGAKLDDVDAQLGVVEANLSAVSGKIDALESPPMFG